MSLGAASWAVFVLLVAAATLYDARHYRIPNAITAALALAGLAALGIEAPSLLVEHAVAGAAALAAGYLLFLFTGFGAGDAKLFGAAMVWFGVGGLMAFLFWFGVACAALVLILIPARRIFCDPNAGLGRWRPFQKGAPVPLALALGPAAVIASLQVSGGAWTW